MADSLNKSNKRILVTSTDLMMIQFLVPHVQNLAQHGYEVEIACSDVGGRMDEVREKLTSYVKAIHTVRLVRSPASSQNIKGYGDMKAVIEQGNYDIIWTNEPVMGVVTRLAARVARKKGTTVLYMVHGFHFFKGASIVNWLLYYPVERFMSLYTDVLVTINQEDFARAKKMYAKEVKYIHGIGINTDRLQQRAAQTDIRAELGLAQDDFLILSVGELSKRKNQKVLLDALGLLKDPKIHYLLCGKGATHDELQEKAKQNGIVGNVHFLGYRKDVVDICSQVNLFAHSALHEGLSIASLEAMYCGLPVVISDIRGVGDYLENGKTGYICPVDSPEAFAEAIRTCRNDPELCSRFGKENRERVKPFCLDRVKEEVLDLFTDM